MESAPSSSKSMVCRPLTDSDTSSIRIDIFSGTDRFAIEWVHTPSGYVLPMELPVDGFLGLCSKMLQQSQIGALLSEEQKLYFASTNCPLIPNDTYQLRDLLCWTKAWLQFPQLSNPPETLNYESTRLRIPEQGYCVDLASYLIMRTENLDQHGPDDWTFTDFSGRIREDSDIFSRKVVEFGIVHGCQEYKYIPLEPHNFTGNSSASSSQLVVKSTTLRANEDKENSIVTFPRVYEINKLFRGVTVPVEDFIQIMMKYSKTMRTERRLILTQAERSVFFELGSPLMLWTFEDLDFMETWSKVWVQLPVTFTTNTMANNWDIRRTSRLHSYNLFEFIVFNTTTNSCGSC